MPDLDLQNAYLDQTKKLAAVCATLGLFGDDPVHVLVAQAKRIAGDRKALLAAAQRLTSGEGAVGASALTALAEAVATARTPLPRP